MDQRPLPPRIVLLSGAALAAAAMMMIQTAAATPIINAQLNPSGATPFPLLSFGTASIDSEPVTRGSLSADGETFIFGTGCGIYSGSVPGVVRSPFGLGSTSNYLAAEPNSPLTINFAVPQTAFDLLWGSVDTYNSLIFGTSGQTVSGIQIAKTIDGLNFGTSDVAVEITNLTPFWSVQVISSEPAFEFVPGVPVPEPAATAIFGMGLLGLGICCWRVSRL